MSLKRPEKNEEEVLETRVRDMSFLLRPFLFIMVMWAVFWMDFRFGLELFRLGIYPQHISGLTGVVFSPVIHGNLTHLSNNTLPLLALGASLYYFYPKVANIIVIFSWILSGIIVWLIGRESFHIGASGLIYALAGFIFLSGVLRRQPNLLALSLLVVFLYGGLVWGLFPIQENISWEAHLAGAFSGFMLAVHYRNVGPVSKKYSWDLEEVTEDVETEEAEDLIGDAWKQYSGEHSVRYFYKPHEEDKFDKKE